MASNSEPQPECKFKCEECSLLLNSAESLEVHRQYHQGNLMQQWARKSANSNVDNKDNMTKQRVPTKREFPSNNAMQQGDSLEMQKTSPDYHRTTPEAMYGHPPTPQSYHSASSPYQNNENTMLPNFQNFATIKSESNLSPSSAQTHLYQHFSNFPEQQAYAGMESSPYSEDPNMRHYPDSVNMNMSSFYNHYDRQKYYEHSKQVAAATGIIAGNPLAYPSQPTPSPSPKQCDKCRFVCETSPELIEHMTIVHPQNGQVVSHFNSPNQLMFEQQQSLVKEDEASQSDILDLDSHKVVHPDWTNGKGEKRPNEERNITHSMVWESHQQGAMFHGGRMYMATPNREKLFATLSGEHDKFSPNAMDSSYLNNGVSSSSSEMGSLNQQHLGMGSRPFEQVANTPSSGISSTQVTQVPAASSTAPPSGTKSANWKSNEARRPKTYNCTACNKWFTSSGHLKRHYNTTLHKNAVKSSGQPDPATMPISAHHHPTREASSSKEGRQSTSPREESRMDENNAMGGQYANRLNTMPTLLQHPSNDIFERPGLLHQQHLSSTTGMGGGQMATNNTFTSLPNGSPPNGDAGLSASETRGLLSMTPAHSFTMMSQPHMIPMDAAQFQMYPNELAPHVTQAMDTTISNISTTGEQVQYLVNVDNQPLPSFAQIQAHIGGNYANVGGLGSVMTSISYYPAPEPVPFDTSVNMLLKEGEAVYELNRMHISDQQPQELVSEPMEFSPINENNNNVDFANVSATPTGTDLPTTLSPGSTSETASEPLSVSTNEESKENESGNTSHPTGSPSVSSTVENQEDLSKTKCFDCDKVFNRPCYLTQHNKTCHNGDKPFKCSRCGKRFGTEEVFLRHEGKHAGNKPHKCEMCPKMFNHKTDLRRHICCHTGQKPYSCAICDKGFIRKDHMMKHMDTHLRKRRDKLSAMRS